MSTSDIIAAISVIIAAASLGLASLQYRQSRIKKRTETSQRVDQYQRLTELATRATSQAETAQIITNNAASGAFFNIEDLRVLSEESGKLAAELSTEAEYARPVPSRRHDGSFRR